MADERELYLKSLKKESEKKIEMPSVSEMALSAESAYRFSEKYEAQYQVNPTYDLSNDSTLSSTMNLASVMVHDDLMRRRNSRIRVSAYRMRNEAAFRTKEESYKEKEEEQEKAAMERSGDLTMEVPDIPELQEDLSNTRQQLKGMKGKDAMSIGEAEFLKSYADVVDDLIKTLKKAQKKDSKEVASHLVLAKEKYLFYTQKESRRRLLGRAQANALMDSRQARRQIEEGQSPVDLSGLLSRVASARDRFVDSKGNDNEQGKTVKQALAEYRTHLTDISKLKSTLAFLRGRLQEMNTSDEKQLKPLRDHIYSLSNELHVKQFHADAAEQCIEYLISDHTQTEDAQLFLYAGHIREHFGVSIPGFDENKKLRDQKVAQRIGVQNNRILTVLTDFNVPTEIRTQMQELSTGYEMQELYEKHADTVLTESRAHSEEALNDLRRDHADKADLLSSPVFTDYASLTRSLPYLGNDDLSAGSTLTFTKREFEPPRSKQDMAGHLDRVLTIKDTTKDPQEVRQAILGELPTIRTAFNDINAFMVGRAGTTLLASRTGSDVFGGTAGLPTFKTKVKTLRDLIGSILERKDALLEMQMDHLSKLERKGVDPDTVTDTIQKELVDIWNTLDQASAYIDYREEMIQRSYDLTPAEFARLAPALSVPDHYRFKTYRSVDQAVITQEEYFEHARDKQRSLMRQIGESGELEKAATAMSERIRAREEAERAKAEEARLAKEKEEKRQADWAAALGKLTEAERAGVYNMDMYEKSGRYESMEEVRSAIKFGITFHSEHSNLTSRQSSLHEWIGESENKITSLNAQMDDAGRLLAMWEQRRDATQKDLSEYHKQKSRGARKEKDPQEEKLEAAIREAEGIITSIGERVVNLTYSRQAEETTLENYRKEAAAVTEQITLLEQHINEAVEELASQLNEPVAPPRLSSFMRKPATPAQLSALKRRQKSKPEEPKKDGDGSLQTDAPKKHRKHHTRKPEGSKKDGDGSSQTDAPRKHRKHHTLHVPRSSTVKKLDAAIENDLMQDEEFQSFIGKKKKTGKTGE